ncbi:inhibitor of nuclear factor kappa-B kinase subunit alpha [Trichonephila inaurata madagascariensis]|uniref:IkappaB kinase n=1 Tax=Trichonephila inaurata madagascariensis TaxID=2747483 RepID=A0A8X6YZ98_9ARAC|nr:inhibitor of nuclear factor kappa-B kinase subunit alpha [Trichonephila inaurata madagascariensis]
MSSDYPVEEIGQWKKEKVLGAGGFGYVVLWRNKISNETIALKECRWGHDPMMTPKHRSRWKLEVDMMSRLNHPNVVTAIAVPPELDVPATEMPLLAMEYCSNGDLRKLLNKPENCCGLKEMHVRLIMKHISSAVNYLHSLRIIHRDLKPENIVIQDQNGNTIYKLIDLGYAKELDQGSFCTSFVGTLQYLAPELFMSQKYTCTVDYWSLGLLTHEIITGQRPFLPDKSPAEWIPIIKGKNSTVIRAYLDADKNIIFSDEIAPFHHICSIFKTDVERWLQTMLEWDPKKRGKYESGSAFNLLETMFQKKISHVFCVDTLTLHSFIINETVSLEDFYNELEQETKIPVSQQEIFFPDGHSPELEEGVSQFVLDMEEEETIVFLFNKVSQSSMITSSSTVIPSDVENMMRNPHDKVNYQQQRSIWSQAVYLSQQESSLINKLIQAFKANLMSLLTKASYVRKSISRMTAEMNKLLAKCSLFKSSLEQDIKSYEKQSQSGGFSAETLLEDWKSNFENLKKVDILRQKIVNLEACTSNIATRTAEIQKSPYVRSKQSTSFEDVHQKILNSFAELRKRSSDERRIPHDNVEIVRLLCLCLQHSHTLTEDVIIHIKIVKQIKRDIDDCLPQIVNLLKEISDWEFQIDSWQAKRQQALWKVINALIEKAQHAERSISPLVLSSSPQTLPKRQINNFGLASLSKTNPDLGIKSLHESSKLSTILKTPPIITPPAWQNRLESLTLSSSLSNGEGSVSKMRFNQSYMSDSRLSLSEILDKTTEDSRRVKKENENLMESFQSMMEILKSYPGVNNHGEET